AGKLKLAPVGVLEIVFFHLASVGREILVDVGQADALNGAADQSWNIGMLFPLTLAFQRAQHVVRAAAFALGSSDEQIVARDGERARIPLGGDETEGAN